MTTKKALNGITFLISHHQKVISGLKDLVIKLGREHHDSRLPSELVYALITFSEGNVGTLQQIKKHLEPIKCKHPKKMQDIAGGQRYCMNCNQDL